MSNTKDTSLGHPPKVLDINNSTTVISAIGNCCDLGDILEDLRISPYNICEEMDQYEKEGSIYLFIQWALGQTRRLCFALADKKIPIVRIIFSNGEYGGVWSGGPPCRGYSSV